MGRGEEKEGGGGYVLSLSQVQQGAGFSQASGQDEAPPTLSSPPLKGTMACVLN